MWAYLQSDDGGRAVLWACVLIGVPLILSGLRGRRARGPRCWRCDYDMTGAAGLICPECGCVHRNSAQFLRTRRLWKRAFVGVLLVAFTCYALSPVVRERVKGREPWYLAVLPDTALIFLLPHLPEDDTYHLSNRFLSDLDVDDDPHAPGFCAEEMYLPTKNPWSDWQTAIIAQRCRVMLGDPATYSVSHRMVAVDLLRCIAPHIDRPAEQLLFALRDPDIQVGEQAALVIGEIGALEDAVINALLAALTDESDNVAEAAARALADNRSPRAAHALLMLYCDESRGPFARGGTNTFLSHHPHQIAGMALVNLGAAGAASIADVLPCLRELDESTQNRLLDLLHEFGEHAEVAVPALLAIQAKTDPDDFLEQERLRIVIEKCREMRFKQTPQVRYFNSHSSSEPRIVESNPQLNQ